MPSASPYGTPLLDNFNRANGALGANWTSPLMSGFGDFEVISSQFGSTGEFKSSGWVTSFPESQDVFATISVMPAVAYIRLMGRSQNLNSGAENNYNIIVTNSGQAWFEKFVAAAGSTILAIGGGAAVYQAGDGISLTMKGSGPTTLEAWRYRTGAWSMLETTTDSSVTDGGVIGAQSGGESSVRLDDFGGGDIMRYSTLAWMGA